MKIEQKYLSPTNNLKTFTTTKFFTENLKKKKENFVESYRNISFFLKLWYGCFLNQNEIQMFFTN